MRETCEIGCLSPLSPQEPRTNLEEVLVETWQCPNPAVGGKRGIDDAERVTPTNAATNVACTLNLHCAGAAPIPLPHWILRILGEYGQQQQQRGHQVKLVVAARVWLDIAPESKLRY